MNGRSSLAVVLLATTAGCLVYTSGPEFPEEPSEHRVVRTALGEGRRRETTFEVAPDGRQVRDGAERELGADGTLLAERRFRAGRPIGTWRTWFPDGSLRSEVELGDGASLGWHRHWHPGTILAAEGQARGEVREGPWRFWDALGNLADAGPFLDGRRHGDWTHWRDGRKVAAGRYERGVRVGRWTLWDEHGVAHERDGGEGDSGY